MDNTVLIARGERVGERRRVNSDGRSLDLGGEHRMQWTNNMLYNCAHEIYIILLTDDIPIKPINI